MLPTFHLNNFKPWATPHRKPFSPHKSPIPSTPRTQKLPCPKPFYTFLPSTLPIPKHHLPARPPAEVCVHASANAQPRIPLTSQFQPRQTSKPQPNTYSENPKYGVASPHDSAPYISDLGPIPRCDLKDDTGIPIEPPAFRGDFAEDGLSSPSISSSDDSLEEFFRLPDAQNDIPIDPVILAGPWEESDHQQPVPQAESLINSEPTYPDPPPVLHSPPDHYRDSSERAGTVISGQVTTLISMIINCTPPNTTRIPTRHAIIVPVETPISVDSSKALSGRRNNQTAKLAKGFEFPLRYRQRSIHSPRFVLTLCLYHLTNVCNSSRGYLKALYHVAGPTLRQQHVKTDMRGKPAA